MNITKETIKDTLRTVMAEETEYQTFFKKALEKAGKSIPSMSDEEKKEFFNKIDAAWNAKGEKNEGNAFGAAVVAAKEKGEDEFEVGGKTYKVESVNEYDQWRNTRIQSKHIFRMLKQKYNNNIPKMEKGLETILKQNKTKNDQAEVVRQEFKKYFKIKESVNEVAYNDAIVDFNKKLEKDSKVKKIASYYKTSTKTIVKALQPMITVLRYNDKSIKSVSVNFTDALSGPTTVKLSQSFNKNESVNESAGCGCGCGCGGSKVNEEFKSKDSTFEKVYGIFDKKDYFNAKGLAKVQIGNFERALQRNDKGAQQILDKFKGDMDKAKDYIIQVITDRKKEESFNDYKAFKAAVDSIQKGKPITGAVDLVKRRIHNNSQKYTMALYSALRNQKFNKWKDIHSDVDSLIGEVVKVSEELTFEINTFLERPVLSKNEITLEKSEMKDVVTLLVKEGFQKRLSSGVKKEFIELLKSI